MKLQFATHTVEEIDITASTESGASGNGEVAASAQHGGSDENIDASRLQSVSSVREIKGIGPRYTKLLAESRVKTLDEFAKLSESTVAGILPVSAEQARTFIKTAKRLLGQT